MRLAALMPVRNEAWIAGLSLRVALRWCDEVVCLNHASTDRTGEVLAEVATEHPGRVTIIEEPAGTWAEMAHRQQLLAAARQRGATHCAIVDADEVITGDLMPQARALVEHLPAAGYLQVAMPCMWRAAGQYRQDASIWSRASVTMAFRDHPSLYWKSDKGYDYHHRDPYNSRAGQKLGPERGGVMHLQWVYWRRLRAKQALYKMIETVRYPGLRSPAGLNEYYGHAVDEVGIRLAAAPPAWWAPYRDLMHHLDLSHEPWQEGECKRLWVEHGAAKFRGLDLFGVVQ